MAGMVSRSGIGKTPELFDPIALSVSAKGSCHNLSEMWHEPSLLLLHPEISKSMRQFRANNLATARQNAAAHGLPGAQWPWESTSSGYESGPGTAEGEREVRTAACCRLSSLSCVAHQCVFVIVFASSP